MMNKMSSSKGADKPIAEIASQTTLAMTKQKRVAVFGGAQPKEGDPVYQMGLRLGQLLGQAGYTVMTGGYIGTMEAVSRGAAEAGGHVIGVTCEEIEAWRPVKANPWVMEEWRLPSLRQRLFAMIDNCSAAIALPGGIGTLTELALTWNHLLIEALPPKPLILVGEGWKATVEQFFKAFGNYIPENQRRWALFAPDVEQAVNHIVNWEQNERR